ncbi:MAG: hypothetical protein GXX82_10500 [Syntrophorhabdus sp.]|nr:hypothetical protein [Syntrophorhabdus sp.]
MKRSIREMFDAMTRGEVPSAEELDAMHVSLNPGENVARRRQLQDRYAFLGATSIQEGLMAFGFECGDGWLPILEKLFAGFQELADKDGTASRFTQRSSLIVPCWPHTSQVTVERASALKGQATWTYGTGYRTTAWQKRSLPKL